MLTTLLLALMLQVPPAQDARISVFVTAPLRDGFVDTNKPIEDSIKDIRGELKGMKELRLLDRAEGADMVLVVVARGVGSQAYGVRTNINEKLYTGTDITTVPIGTNTCWVSVVMQVGAYRKELVGRDTASSTSIGPFWRLAGEQVAKNIKAWSLANAEQVRATRGR